MENLLEAIRAAVAADATDDAKVAGAAACRTILGAIEPASVSASMPTPVAPNPVAHIVSALRGVPPDQLLDLAIARLRAALPPGTEVPPAQPMKFHLISVPPQLAPRSGR